MYMPPDNSLPTYVRILDLILLGFLIANRNKATVNTIIPKYRLVLLTKIDSITDSPPPHHGYR